MTKPNLPPTLETCIDAYIDGVRLSRSQNTAITYRKGLALFKLALEDNGIDPATAPADSLPEDAVGWAADALKDYARATESVFLTAIAGFYEYLAANGLAQVNLPRVRLLIKQRARRPGQRLPQFPADDIQKVLAFAESLRSAPVEAEEQRLINLRDRAFLITLADTGLRVHEACGLRRGDIDIYEQRAIIIGKGNKQAVVRFSARALEAIKDYLAERQALDGKSNRPLGSLPLFARHDRGAGKKVKPITTVTGRNIVTERVRQALGEAAVGSITPHSFRHYFVTTVLRGSGNLKLAQELARHQNIAVTQRYAHLSDDELDKGYRGIFDERKK